MADIKHGVYTRQVDTSIATPVVASAGIPFVVGAAPVQMADTQTVNEPILCYSYAEAVTALGMADDWEKYPVCEAIYAQFVLYNVAPIVVTNVLDPSKHKTTVEAADYDVEEGQVFLPLETIKDTVVVTGYTDDDYDLFYDDGALVLEFSTYTSIPSDVTALEIAYTMVAPEKVDSGDVIGGFNVNTKKNEGLETINDIFSKYSVLVDIIIAPGWSQIAEVAAIMGAKAECISGFFQGVAICDVDVTEVKHYTDVPAWKKAKNIFSKHQILCWPAVKLGERRFRKSTQIAALMGKTDNGNSDCPYESPSNKSMQIDTCVVGAAHEEETVFLGVTEANYLNGNGVVTALNHIGGYVAWGNYTACYPSDTDVKNYFIPVSRMFYWVASTLILTYWSKTDKPMTKRLVDTVVDSTNIWLNGLYAEEKILGGRVEFLSEENPTTSLMAGSMTFHVYLTPPSPAQEIEFVLEYDVNYVEAALG